MISNSFHFLAWLSYHRLLLIRSGHRVDEVLVEGALVLFGQFWWEVFTDSAPTKGMTLPFDPAELSEDDIGEKRTTLDMEHEEAIEFVRACCEEAGFGIPVEFSPSDLLNEKVDAGRDPYYVLGACNPKMADRALDLSDKQIGGLFPCNVIVWEIEPGRQQVYHVSIMKIARLAGMAPDSEEWEELVSDTGELVDSLFERIEEKGM